MKNEELVVEILRDIVNRQDCNETWSSSNQILLMITDGKEGQGELNPKFFEKYEKLIGIKRSI